MLQAAARYIAADGHVGWKEYGEMPAPMRELLPLVRAWSSEMQREKMERERKAAAWRSRSGRPGH